MTLCVRLKADVPEMFIEQICSTRNTFVDVTDEIQSASVI